MSVLTHKKFNPLSYLYLMTSEKIQKHTGLNFGQIVSVIGLAGAILAVWVRLEIAVATLNVRTDTNDKRYEQLLEDNKVEHKAIIDKLDKIMLKDNYQNR